MNRLSNLVAYCSIILNVMMLSVILSGCALFKDPVIYESRSNVATKITDGVFVSVDQYMELVDGKGITKPETKKDYVGQYYLPSKYFEVKADGLLYLKVQEKK